jgi:cytochrome c biogenesis protein ResB
MSAKQKSFAQQVFDVFSSFWLCCVLLLALFVLTIFGTLHQVDYGLYDAKQVYFHSFFLWAGGLPIFPGGLLCMIMLSINLVLGGFVRIKWRSRNIGVLIVHVGIVILLGSGLSKIMNSEEGYLQVFETQSNDYFQSYQLLEVAIWEIDGPADAKEHVIQDDFFTDLKPNESRTFTSEDLPFELTLTGFHLNCQVLPTGPNWRPDGKAVQGYAFLSREKQAEAERNRGGINASIKADNGMVKEALLWSAQVEPWAFKAGGKAYAIDIRPERYSMPYAIRLEDFIKEEHPGIGMAKAYRSKVTQVFSEDNERPVLIQMNEPLRDGGLVLFQSSYGVGQGGQEYSVFSVVRNPSDKWPEYSMWIITVGMLVAFGRRLIGYIKTQSQRRQKAAGAKK